MPEKRNNISLVVMPVAELSRPCIALGILKGSLSGLPFDCDVSYANLKFAEKIGLKKHLLLIDAPGKGLVPEWLFSRYVFSGWQSPGEENYIRLVAKEFIKNAKLAPSQIDHVVNWYYEIREAAEKFVVDLAEQILQRSPVLVGCSSLFYQHLPSLALLKAVKERSPDTLTIIGGANCEGIQGVTTIKEFPFVDIAFSGEADVAFPEICRLAAKYRSAIPSNLLPYGAFDYTISEKYLNVPDDKIPRAIVENLDSCPPPDYDDYFDQLETSELKPRITPALLFDSSRGCWWGQKHGCTFCGLNGAGIKYRKKDHRLTLKSIKTLAERHKVHRVSFTDNIMNMEYFKTFLPELEKAGSPYSIFYETKSNLTKSQIEQFAKAGAKYIQPGIESLHGKLLRLMNKGVTAATNIQTLKYCREYGILPQWNLIVNFPGEDDSWHRETTQLIPLLHHLQAPCLCVPIRFQRFSEYFENPEKYNLKLEPLYAYRVIYNLPPEAIYKLAYHFDDLHGCYDIEQMTDKEGILSLNREVSKWIQLYANNDKSPVLQMTDNGDRIDIHDTRSCAVAEDFYISGLDADVYRKCDPALSREKLFEAMAEIEGDESRINASIEALMEKKLLVDIDGKLLSLALAGNILDLKKNENENLPSGYTLMPFYESLFGTDSNGNLLISNKMDIASKLMSLRKK